MTSILAVWHTVDEALYALWSSRPRSLLYLVVGAGMASSWTFPWAGIHLDADLAGVGDAPGHFPRIGS
eukprot:9408145-Pyramimonas_sp.AAC.2